MTESSKNRCRSAPFGVRVDDARDREPSGASFAAPPSRGGVPSLAVWLVVAVTGACLLGACSTLSSRARRVAERFVGLDAAIVRKCLGDTVYLDVREDGSELWAFSFGTPEVGSDIAIRRVTGQGTAYARPAIETGSPTERRNAAEGARRLLEDRVDAGQCVHIFAMVGGRVSSYVGRGRDASGLNADSLCITLLEPCIDGVERAEKRLR